MGKNNFFSHSRNYLLAEFFNKGILFITLPIFTYLLTPQEFGIISLYTTISSIFIIFLGLNSHSSISRAYHEENMDFANYVGSNLVFLFSINMFFLLILFLFSSKLANFFAIETEVYFIAITISFLSVFMQLELSYLQTSQQSEQYVKILIVRNISLTFGAMICMSLLNNKIYFGKFYSDLLVSFIIFIFAMINLIRLSKFELNFKYIKYFLSYSIPLIPHSLAGLIILQSDILMINKFMGEYQTGLYAFAFNIGMIMLVFVTAFNNAWLPVFYKELKNKNYLLIQDKVELYTKIIFFVLLILVLFSKEIVIIMANKDYYNALDVIPIILFSFVFVYLYTLFVNYAFYRKKTMYIAIITIFVALVNIILNYYYIPLYGYISAAYTTLFSYFLLFLFNYCNSKYILKEYVINLKNILKNLIILMMIVIVYFNLNINNYLLLIIFKIFLVIAFSFFYFRKDLFDYLKIKDKNV